MRIKPRVPALVYLSNDNWQRVEDTPPTDSGLGLHFVTISCGQLPSEPTLVFILYWLQTEH